MVMRRGSDGVGGSVPGWDTDPTKMCYRLVLRAGVARSRCLGPGAWASGDLELCRHASTVPRCLVGLTGLTLPWGPRKGL